MEQIANTFQTSTYHFISNCTNTIQQIPHNIDITNTIINYDSVMIIPNYGIIKQNSSNYSFNYTLYVDNTNIYLNCSGSNTLNKDVYITITYGYIMQ